MKSMKRNNTCVLLCAMILLTCFLLGCSASGKKATGIRTASGKEYYIIDLKEAQMEDYFTLCGEKSKVSVLNTQTAKTQITYYQPIEEGGWVAYKEGSIIAYFPAAFSQGEVKNACAMLTLSSDGMTVEEAKKYIPWLGE